MAACDCNIGQTGLNLLDKARQPPISPCPSSFHCHRSLFSMSSSPQEKRAILVAHGQPSAPEPAERSLAELAQKVSLQMPDWQIKSATLAMPGQLEHLMEDGTVIYPFFMTGGWFTNQVLPKRLHNFSYQMTPPFGLDPNLVPLAASYLKNQLCLRTGTPAILLAAHGSARSAKAAQATEAFANQLSGALPETPIHIGYIEQAPFVSAAARDLPANSLCLPFFAQSGHHVRDDIPAALAEADFRGSLLPVLGAHAQVPSLIAHTLGAHAAFS